MIKDNKIFPQNAITAHYNVSKQFRIAKKNINTEE